MTLTTSTPPVAVESDSAAPSRPWWANPNASVSTSSAGPAPRTWSGKAIAGVAAATMLTGAALYLAARDDPYPATTAAPAGGVQHAPTVTAFANGCSGVFTFPEQPTSRPVDPGARIEYEAVTGVRIPAFGPYATHVPQALSTQRIYRAGDPQVPSVTQLLAAQRAGWRVIWYAGNATAADVAAATQTVNAVANTVLVPWPESVLSTVPMGRAFAFSGWGVSQSCSRFSGAVFGEFTHAVAGHRA